MQRGQDRLKLRHFVGQGTGTTVDKDSRFVSKDVTVLESEVRMCIETATRAEEATGTGERTPSNGEYSNPEVGVLNLGGEHGRS
jgi:hypothetical protein